MQPADHGQRRIQDERQPQVAAPAAVQDQVPAGNAVALAALHGDDVEIRQPRVHRCRGCHGVQTAVRPDSMGTGTRRGLPLLRPAAIGSSATRTAPRRLGFWGGACPPAVLRAAGHRARSREIGRPHVLRHAHVAAETRPRRDDAVLADDGDAGVEPRRLLAVGRVEVGASSDHRVRPDRDLLVQDRVVDHGAGPDVPCRTGSRCRARSRRGPPSRQVRAPSARPCPRSGSRG